MDISQSFVIFITVFILAMDVMLLWNKHKSESQVIRNWALDWTWVPFFGGIILGHWFFPGHGIRGDLWGTVISLSIMIAYDFSFHKWGPEKKVWWRYPGIYAILGIPVGVFFWGQ